MKKKVIVLSVGGSLIIPDKVNFKFLDKLKSILQKNYKTHKFVIVTGGGSTARKYIEALKKEGKSKRELSEAGIRATKTNAQFLMQFFGKSQANDTLPKNMKEIKSNLSKNQVVICGALRYTKNSTSDSTAASLANYLSSEFINLTNVKGLYTSNPATNKKAKLIPKISWQDFNKITKKIKFKAGQHFVLDQKAAEIINKNKIPTYILGENLSNLSKVLKDKKFTGTLIKN